MIEVKNVTKKFYRSIRKEGIVGMMKTMFSRKKEEVIAVNNVSFTINDGEIVGYIGANGAGKSTTIKMMSGILTPTSGQVLINGLEPYSSKNRNKVLQNIGVVFGQRTQLWFDLPLIESFSLLKKIYEIPEKEYQERFSYLCKVLDIDEFLHSPVRTLSLGQRMRADLAASMLHNPAILFLDEPTIGLDVLVKEKIISAIKEINKKYNTTIILTTHDMNDITDLCNRIIIIDTGSILYDGSLSKIQQKFGDNRRISFITKNDVDYDTFIKHFDDKVTIEKENEYHVVAFDGSVVKIKDVISYIFNLGEISDIKISGTTLAQIVKHIYESKRV